MRVSPEDSLNSVSLPYTSVSQDGNFVSAASDLPVAGAKAEYLSPSSARNLNLFMFGSLYFAQGAMVAYFNNFQKPYLNSLGIDADVIGLLSGLLLVPFIIKIGIGLLSDRVSLFGFGYRKPYILLGLFLSIVMLGAASRVRPDISLALFATLLFLASLGMALFDTAADGLAIDITETKSQGTVQASMVAGRALGLIIISWFCGMLAERGDYSVILLVISLCLFIPLFWIVRFREFDRRTKRSFKWGAFAELLRARVLIFSAYIFGSMLIMWGGINGLITYYMSHDLNASPAQIGRYGALVGVGSVVGALVAGLALDRWYQRLTAYFAIVAISLTGLLLSLTTEISQMYALGSIWGWAFGFQQTVLVALAMRLTDVRVPASMFTIMMTIANVGLVIGETVTTSLTDNLGFSHIFWLLSVANLLLIPVLWVFFKFRDAGATAVDSDGQSSL